MSYNILILIAFFILLYFFMVRPQQKQQKKRREMLQRLTPGSEVVLISGLHGKIDSVDDEAKTLTVDADGVYLTFDQSAVRTIVALDKHVEAKPDKHAEKRAAKAIEEPATEVEQAESATEETIDNNVESPVTEEDNK